LVSLSCILPQLNARNWSPFDESHQQDTAIVTLAPADLKIEDLAVEFERDLDVIDLQRDMVHTHERGFGHMHFPVY